MTDTAQGLTADQIASFQANGYLVLPHHLPEETVSRLLETTDELLNNFPLESHPLTCFTTGDDSEHVGDKYFIESNDKIHFFLEPDAFEAKTDAGGKLAPCTPTLARPKHLAVNKIGHALHSLSRPFADATHTGTVGARNAAIARSLGYQDPRVLQSMVICKQPGIGAAVPQHKDSEFLYTNPPSAIGWWYALQDAGVENGGLGFWRGSHKRSPVQRRFVRKTGATGGTEFIAWDGPGLPEDMNSSSQASTIEGNYEPDEADFEFIDAPAGSLVLIHGNVLHASERNKNEKSRFAYTFHVIEGSKGWEYDERNWLQPPESDGEFTKLYSSDIAP